MARKTNKIETMTHLYKTRNGRYGAIVGVHTLLRYIPDEDGLIYIEDKHDLQGFLDSGAWAVYADSAPPENPFEEIMKDDE